MFLRPRNPVSISDPHHPRFLQEPDLGTSLHVLEDLTRGLGERTAVHRTLADLLEEGEPQDRGVDIRDITAIGQSKGRFCGNLDRLVTTISEPPPEVRERAKHDPEKDNAELWREVQQEFGLEKDGRFTVKEEGWSGRLIACNSGAARRFCLLRQRQLRGQLNLPCRVTTWHLNPDALHILTAEYWVILAPSHVVKALPDNMLPSVTIEEFVGFSSLSLDYTEPSGPRQTRWGFVAGKRKDRRVRHFLLGLMTASLPAFDLSRWLLLLHGGRVAP